LQQELYLPTFFNFNLVTDLGFWGFLALFGIFGTFGGFGGIFGGRDPERFWPEPRVILGPHPERFWSGPRAILVAHPEQLLAKPCENRGSHPERFLAKPSENRGSHPERFLVKPSENRGSHPERFLPVAQAKFGPRTRGGSNLSSCDLPSIRHSSAPLPSPTNRGTREPSRVDPRSTLRRLAELPDPIS